MTQTDKYHYRSCFLDGWHGSPFVSPFRDWHNMHKAAICLMEYQKGEDARIKAGVEKGWLA